MIMKSKDGIELSGLVKRYHKKTVVDIDYLEIGGQEIYGLIGPNGAGKSTTMKMLLGLVRPDGGVLRVMNREVTSTNRQDILTDIGSLIEGPSYYAHVSGIDNLRIVAKLKGYAETDVREALGAVGLENHQKKKVGNYSLGMKQRLGIAMAVLGKPPILILDEPTNGLDPVGKEEMRELIRVLSRENHTTILISSHNLDEIEKLASHIGIIQRGKLLFDGSLTAFRREQPPEIEIRTSNDARAAQLLGQEWNARSESIRLGAQRDAVVARAVRTLIEEGIEIYRVVEVEKSLEQLFIDRTGRGSI